MDMDGFVHQVGKSGHGNLVSSEAAWDAGDIKIDLHAHSLVKMKIFLQPFFLFFL